MAKIECTLYGDFNYILSALHDSAMNNSTSASYEDGSDMAASGCLCAVRVYERYSFSGDNRVSLNLTLMTAGDGVSHLCAITSGGSQALFFKLNTLGESAFLDTINAVVERFSR